MKKREFNWINYNKVRKDNPPRETLVFALTRFSEEKKKQRSAFDIGCGPGVDTAELLRQGWHVTSTDSNHDVLNYLMPLRKKHSGKHSIQIASFEDINWKKVDLVNASFTLPFCPKEHFDALWRNIVSNIKPGGRFSGQFFGKKDEFKMLIQHTRKDLKKMFEGFKIEMLGEVEKDDRSSDGSMKHWHIFNVVGRKL